jgi:hypothetical protein
MEKTMSDKDLVDKPPINNDFDPITYEELKQALPTKMKGNISPATIKQINDTMSDSMLLSDFKNSIISYATVLSEGAYTLKQYLDAVKYVSYKVMGYTNKDAYIKTHPNRYAKLVANHYSTKDIASIVYQYNCGKLVNNIYSLTMIPTSILNAPVFQQAINVQAELMLHAKSETVRQKAADSLMVHLKAPEVAKMELSVKSTEDDSIKALRETTLALARQQKLMIEAGASSAESIAGSKLVVVEVDKDTDVEEGKLSD